MVTSLEPKPIPIQKRERTYTMGVIELCLTNDGFSQDEVTRVVTSLELKPITIEDAAAEFGVRQGTLHMWILKGHLHRVGRIRFPAPGGGKVLIDRSQLEELLKNPPRNGRPPKKAPEQV